MAKTTDITERIGKKREQRSRENGRKNIVQIDEEAQVEITAVGGAHLTLGTDDTSSKQNSGKRQL